MFNTQITMQKITKFYCQSALALFLFVVCFSYVFAETQVNIANVTATVLGEKPIVNLIAPTSGTNTGATILTKIVGRNFDNSYGVSLDDRSSTVLVGTITVTDDCDSNGDNWGGGGSYQLITGLSVPAGVRPGVYNVLVTTALGTNLLSDVKFTVTAPVATATPSITNVSPSYVSVMASLVDTVTVDFTIKDSDTAIVDFDGDSNVLITGATVDTHSPVSQETSTATAADGENVSFVFHSNSAGEEYGTLDIRVGDGGSPTTGNTDVKTVDVFVEPSW